jgi:hypothetical protein
MFSRQLQFTMQDLSDFPDCGFPIAVSPNQTGRSIQTMRSVTHGVVHQRLFGKFSDDHSLSTGQR